jgi:hypothetical protein
LYEADICPILAKRAIFGHFFPLNRRKRFFGVYLSAVKIEKKILSLNWAYFGVGNLQKIMAFT